MIKALRFLGRLLYAATAWRTFKVPHGEFIGCYKDRSRVDAVLVTSRAKVNWLWNEVISQKSDPGRVSPKGVGSGTPMQLGNSETRIVTWGSGYGRYNQWKTTIPKPLLGGRYWITGYPTHQYDKRCIIMGPDGCVHELIQFDQDAPVQMAGLPQQALNRGRWKDGKLIDGVAVTASGLPGSAYIWGIGSIDTPHVQAMTVEDYLAGDGSDTFYNFGAAANILGDLPRCGDWFYLPKDSDSYKEMVDLGGQCESRAKALNEYGVKLIDRGGTTSFLTQAGSWADNTNIRDFQINLNDLRRVY